MKIIKNVGLRQRKRDRNCHIDAFCVLKIQRTITIKDWNHTLNITKKIESFNHYDLLKDASN
jgi:hypothetical protein